MAVSCFLQVRRSELGTYSKESGNSLPGSRGAPVQLRKIFFPVGSLEVDDDDGPGLVIIAKVAASSRDRRWTVRGTVGRSGVLLLGPDVASASDISVFMTKKRELWRC